MTRRAVALLAAVLVSELACESAGPSVADADADAEADEVRDSGLEDAGTDGTCPEVTPDVQPLSFETMASIAVDLPTPSSPGLNLQASFCRCPGYVPVESLADDGTCTLVRSLVPAPTPACEALDAGEIRVSVAGTEAVLEAVPGPCTLRPGSPLPDPEPGDAVRAWSGGGTDVPAFDLSLVVPDDVTRTEPPDTGAAWQSCGPWRIAWTPVAAGRVSVTIERFERAPDRYAFLTCEDVPGPPPFEVPAGTAALWPLPGTVHVKVGAILEASTSGEVPVTLFLRSFRTETVATVDVEP